MRTYSMLNNHWGDDRLDILCIASLTVTLTWGDDRFDMSSISPPSDTFKTHIINIPLFGNCFPVACYSSGTQWALTSNTMSRSIPQSTTSPHKRPIGQQLRQANIRWLGTHCRASPTAVERTPIGPLAIPTSGPYPLAASYWRSCDRCIPFMIKCLYA